MKPTRFLQLVALFLASVAAAHAQFIWTGAGANNDTTNSANWFGGVAPVGDGTEDVIFGTAPRSQPDLPANFSIHHVTITGSTLYFWGDNGGATNLTLTGDVTSTVGSSGFFVFNQDKLTLSAGTHFFTAGAGTTGTDLYLFGSLAGSGNIVKTGPRTLTISSPNDASTFTGNIDLQQGDLNVAGDGSLGTGTIKLNGGRLSVAHYDSDHTVRLDNNFLFSNNVSFGGGGASNLPDLIVITGSATALAGNTAIQFNTDYDANVRINGGVGETTAGTRYTINGPGTVIFGGSGPNSYTGGTFVPDGSTFIFGSAAPAVGTLLVSGRGYLGTEVTTGVQAGFLDRFNLAVTDGIIGFDSPSVSFPLTFGEAIDLSGFSDSNVRIGSATSAILGVNANITPQGNDYLFGGRGILRVDSDLADITSLSEVRVYDGLQLYLNGNNSYTGETEAVVGAIIFTSPNAIPVGGDIYADVKGYIGQTESSLLDVPTYFSHFYTPVTFGVVGFDADDLRNGRIMTEDIDFSVFDQGAYLGTSTKVTLTGDITPYNGTHRFTGFRNGQLTVSSFLTGSDSVIIGLPSGHITDVHAPGQVFAPSVTLDGTNDYTGGTTLMSGILILGNASALGTGALAIDHQYLAGQPAVLQTSTSGLVIPNALNFVNSPGFFLGGSNDFTLAGNFVSAGEGLQKIDANTVTLSGDNSAYAGYFNVLNGTLVFANNRAAGTGSLFLDDVNGSHGHAIFTTANPIMGSLSGRSVTSVDLGAGTLTINQQNNDVFSGAISGSGNLVKNGSGSLTLDGTNTYGGTTTILGGNLVAGSSGALPGAVVINGGMLSVNSGVVVASAVSFGASGGFLAGNGTFSAPIAIGTNARLTPGNSVGLLNFSGGLTWAQNGAYDVQIQTAGGGAGTGYDTITVTGGLVFNATLGNPFVLNLSSLNAGGGAGNVSDFNSSSSYAWVIAQSDSLTGFDPANFTIVTTGFTNSLGGGVFDVSSTGNNIFLNFTPVPEPSTYALIGLGLGAVLFPALRRRKRV